jgi:hypothetical protein
MASPLGKALLGRVVKDEVEITLPMGQRRLKVVELQTVHELAGGASPAPRKPPARGRAKRAKRG